MALVVRREERDGDVRLVLAANAAMLADEAARVMAELGGALDDGLYICTTQLQAAAEFPPLTLPDDALTVGEAGSMLWPDASRGKRWERLKALRDAGALRVYFVFGSASAPPLAAGGEARFIAYQRGKNLLVMI